MALGRRAFTHNRIEDVDSIMFPKIIHIDGKPLNQLKNNQWRTKGWKELNNSKNSQDGVGGIAGIWHSDKAGNSYFQYFYLISF